MATTTAQEWAARGMPEMATKPKMIFFTDFDGTITLADSNDYMTDNLGYGYKKRRQGNIDVLENRRTFRDAFQEMLDTVTTPFPECIEILKKNIKLDPGFKEFFDWSRTKNVPIVVLSGGMEAVIKALLDELVGEENTKTMRIVSNFHGPQSADVSVNDPAGWKVNFLHPESEHGHDKSRAIRPFAALSSDERPVMLYAGDGVSDLSAARETDLLFAKQGQDLVTWCVREQTPFITFATWTDILAECKKIYDGEKTAGDVAAEGFAKYKSEAK